MVYRADMAHLLYMVAISNHTYHLFEWHAVNGLFFVLRFQQRDLQFVYYSHGC